MTWSYDLHWWAKPALKTLDASQKKYMETVGHRRKSRFFVFGGCLFWLVFGFFALLYFALLYSPAIILLAVMAVLAVLQFTSILLEGLLVYPGVLVYRAIRRS